MEGKQPTTPTHISKVCLIMFDMQIKEHKRGQKNDVQQTADSVVCSETFELPEVLLVPSDVVVNMEKLLLTKLRE